MDVAGVLYSSHLGDSGADLLTGITGPDLNISSKNVVSEKSLVTLRSSFVQRADFLRGLEGLGSSE